MPLTPRQQERVTPVVAVVQAARPAVVNISATHVVTERQSVFDFFEPFETGERTTRSVGSGSVIHPLGYVLTNAHVVDQASELSVTDANGKTHPAHVVAAIPEEDIALVKVQLPTGERWPAIRLGRTDDLLVGESVVAIGNPVGLGHSVTTGIVSAVDRSFEPRRGVRIGGLLQTDAAINPGNSGGPLLNIVGEQIGVNTAIRNDAQNVGFAIAVDTVRRLLPRLLDVESVVNGKGGRRWLGATLAFRPDADGVEHLQVLSVRGGSPAALARVDEGVELVGVNDIDGDAVSLLVALSEVAMSAAGAEPVEVVLRLRHPEGSIEVARVGLTYRAPPDGKALALARLGVGVADLDTASALRLGLRGGIVVTSVSPRSPAAGAGIQRGDLLVRLGRLGLSRVNDLVVLDEVSSGTPLALRVVRIDRRRIRAADVSVVPAD